MSLFLSCPHRSESKLRRSLPHLFGWMLALALVLGGVCDLASAQDELVVPGLTDNAEPDLSPPPGAVVSEDGTISQQNTSLFGLIAAGGWAMWILGLFSIVVIGLGFYCFFDIPKIP